jgi:hypothetical protein
MGMINCDGCSSRFCLEHFTIHRRELDLRFEHLYVDQGIFRQKIQEISKGPTESLLKIDAWEKEMLLSIQRVADGERRRIRELTEIMSGLANHQLMDWLHEWERRKETGDYFEQELGKLEQRLNQLKTEVIEMTQLQIVPLSIDWSNAFHIEKDSFLGTSLLSKRH